jgi:hypothetical protein
MLGCRFSAEFRFASSPQLRMVYGWLRQAPAIGLEKRFHQQ